MSNISAKNSSGLAVYLKSSGSGSDPDPWIPEHSDTNIGARADLMATSDTGTFSLISLIKRLISMGMKDAGPAWTVTRTYTTSTDMTTAATISVAPTSSQYLYADDVIVSAAVAMEFTLQEETSATVLASVFIPTSGTVVITTRDAIKVPTADRRLFGKASVAGNVRVFCAQHSAAS